MAGRGLKPLLPRLYGYRGCLSASSSFESFADWFLAANLGLQLERLRSIDQAVNYDRDEHALLEGIVRNVKHAVQHVLSPYGTCYLDYRITDYAPTITDTTRHTQLELDQLSDGVQAVVAMVGDIASRASILNPQYGVEAAKRTSGVVLIDEVDMHLHPAWQQSILILLGEAFPLIQFVVTTHSPQVLTSLRKENIRILQEGGDGCWAASMPEQSPLAKESGDALALIMGAHPRPDIPGVVSDIHTYESLARAGGMDSEKAKAVRKRLDEAGFEFSDAELALFQFLSQEHAALEGVGG